MKRLFGFLLDSGPIAALAVIAFAGSFSHIRATATDHGQKGSMAVAVAVCIDLCCMVAARERQRDKKAGRKAGWPTTVLVGGVLLSLAANLDQAEHTAWGWVTAGAPCAAFVVAVSLLERRGAHRPAEEPQKAPVARETPVRREAPVRPPAPVRRAAPPARPAAPAVRKSPAAANQVKDDILPRAREVAEAFKVQEGKPISRDRLKQELGVSTARATTLRRELRAAGV